MLHQELSNLISKLCDADLNRKEIIKYPSVPIELFFSQPYEPDAISLKGYGLANQN